MFEVKYCHESHRGGGVDTCQSTWRTYKNIHPQRVVMKAAVPKPRAADRYWSVGRLVLGRTGFI